MKVTTEKDTVIIELDSVQYSEDVLYKCFYWYTDKFTVTIEKNKEEKTVVALQKATGNADDINPEMLMEKIKNDLIDFKLRDIVTKETKIIRELIVAKAFSHYEESDNPETDVSDSVGFNISAI